MVFYCYLPIFATQERKRTHNTESSSIQRKRGITDWSPSTEKRKRRRKKEEEEEATADNEGVIGDCVGNLLAAASTGHTSCFVVFFFFLFFFFFWGTCLLLLWFFFFFLTSPFVQDLKLSDLLPIFILLRAFSFLLDLIITSYQCIGQNSQESWNKKKPFEPQKLVTVHKTGRSDRGPCGSLLFWHGIVLLPKQTVKQNGSRFFRLDHTVRFGFQNL